LMEKTFDLEPFSIFCGSGILSWTCRLVKTFYPYRKPYTLDPTPFFYLCLYLLHILSHLFYRPGIVFTVKNGRAGYEYVRTCR
jgi:hypothetical protein